MAGEAISADIAAVKLKVEGISKELDEISGKVTAVLQELSSHQGSNIFGVSDAGLAAQAVFDRAVVSVTAIMNNSQLGARELTNGTRASMDNIERSEEATVDTLQYARGGAAAAQATQSTTLPVTDTQVQQMSDTAAPTAYTPPTAPPASTDQGGPI